MPKSHAGNALMEYVLPMAAILITCGVLATLLDLNGMMRGFFVAASGHTRADVDESGNFRPEAPGENIRNGTVGTGGNGFRANGFGTLQDGNGRIIETTGGNGNDWRIPPRDRPPGEYNDVPIYPGVTPPPAGPPGEPEPDDGYGQGADPGDGGDPTGGPSSCLYNSSDPQSLNEVGCDTEQEL